MSKRVLVVSSMVCLAALAYTAGRQSADAAPASSPVVAADDHSGHGDNAAPSASTSASTSAQQAMNIPAGAATVAARLTASPRHGEWTKIAVPGMDSIMAYVVYPQRRDNAPVVVVIHEIYGLSTWVRGVADQLAADGFIAISPDLISIERGGATTDTIETQRASQLIRAVTPDKMNAMVTAVGKYGMSLPAARRVYGVVGFCWGGAAVFNHVVANPDGLKGGVVYYGTAPPAEQMKAIKVPVLGQYGESDARVTAPVPGVDSTMKALGKSYQFEIFAGAAHGFVRAQDVAANAAATAKSWPTVLAFFRKNLGT